MKYSDEFKDLVMDGYYCGTLTGTTIRFPNLDLIRTFLETGDNNVELGKLLKEGATSNDSFSAREILNYLERLNLNELRKYAEMAIIRKRAYTEWQQKYSVQMQTQQHIDMPTLAELKSHRSGR